MDVKYCLITGAAGGFGKAYTHTLIERGYTLILTDFNADHLNALKEECQRRYGKEVTTFISDIRQDGGMQNIWHYLMLNDIKLSLVVNTVGLEIEGLFSDLKPEHMSNIVKTNVVGFTNVIAYSLLYKAEKMEIINFGSMAGFYAMPFKAVYAASKAYIISLSRALHLELKTDGVSILVVCPAGVPTRQEVIDRIKRQGVYGKLTTSKVDEVVNKSIMLVRKGKAVYVPKCFNRFLVFITKLLPSLLASKLIAKRWTPKD